AQNSVNRIAKLSGPRRSRCMRNRRAGTLLPDFIKGAFTVAGPISTSQLASDSTGSAELVARAGGTGEEKCTGMTANLWRLNLNTPKEAEPLRHRWIYIKSRSIEGLRLSRH